MPSELRGITLVEEALSSRAGFKRGNMILLEALTEKNNIITMNKGIFFPPGSSNPAKTS
ncbi:MAG: hypothetical protein V3T59_10310 [Desulfobacterales bacterium]